MIYIYKCMNTLCVLCYCFLYCSRSSVEAIPLQQQISVESLTESLTDLQPAAPEVVLPIEPSQAVSSQPAEQSEDSVDPVSPKHKDGHYFLRVRCLNSCLGFGKVFLC
jgi:hypothetical protein